jgi:hypothetical protein
MEYPMDMNLDKDQYRGNTALTLLKKASDTWYLWLGFMS